MGIDNLYLFHGCMNTDVLNVKQNCVHISVPDSLTKKTSETLNGTIPTSSWEVYLSPELQNCVKTDVSCGRMILPQYRITQSADLLSACPFKCRVVLFQNFHIHPLVIFRIK